MCDRDELCRLLAEQQAQLVSVKHALSSSTWTERQKKRAAKWANRPIGRIVVLPTVGSSNSSSGSGSGRGLRIDAGRVAMLRSRFTSVHHRRLRQHRPQPIVYTEDSQQQQEEEEEQASVVLVEDDDDNSSSSGSQHSSQATTIGEAAAAAIDFDDSQDVEDFILANF